MSVNSQVAILAEWLRRCNFNRATLNTSINTSQEDTLLIT
nr:MAG TPA: hypothetical protein [Caudoviricetes sp.]